MDETTFTVIVTSVLIVVLSALVRLAVVLPACNIKHYKTKHVFEKNDELSDIKNNRITILLGSGGHTGEMIRILEQWKEGLSTLNRQYLLSSGDNTSILKLQKLEQDQIKSTPKDYKISTIHRARNIGAGKFAAFVNTLISFKSAFNHIIYQRINKLPKVFLTNGPGTAIPIAYLLFICKYFGLCDTKIIYIESLARVNNLSLTGFLILPISDRIIVQWEPLSKKYRRCEYYGILV